MALEEYADDIAVDGCDYEVVGNKFDGLTEEVVLSFFVLYKNRILCGPITILAGIKNQIH